MIKHWERLTLFLGEPDAPIDRPPWEYDRALRSRPTSRILVDVLSTGNSFGRSELGAVVSDTPPDKSSVNPYESPDALPRRPIPRDVLAICVSFVVLTVWGYVVIVRYWWRTDSIAMGIARGVGFAAIMAGVHFVGYGLWKRQERKQE